MKNHWTVCSAFLLLAACGASGESEHEAEASDLADESILAEEGQLAEEAAELGTLEQALGEAACGTNAVNRAVTFSGSTVRFGIAAPYGSTSCSNAFLTGISSSTPRNGTVSIIGQLNVAKAKCPQAQLRSDYYVNGATVVSQLVSPGVFRNGSCLVSTSYNYNTARTVNSVNGTRAFLAGGTPASSANARFAAQALNDVGAIQNFSWEINP
jgi:hypothetical protein